MLASIAQIEHLSAVQRANMPGHRAGVLDRLFEELNLPNLLRVRIEVVSIDSTNDTMHPDGVGALKRATRASDGAEAHSTPSFWLPPASSRSSACG